MNIHENLKAYLDGELSNHEAELVREAIAADPLLQQEVAFMKLLSNEVREVASAPEPKGEAQVMQKIVGRRGLLGTRALSWVGAAAIIVLVAFVAFPIFPQARLSAKSRALDSAMTESSYEGMPADSNSDVAKRSVAASAAPAPGSAMPMEEAPAGSRAPAVAPGVPPVTANRLVVRNADLGLRVDNVTEALAQVSALSTGFGGFVQESSTSGVEEQRPVASATVRVLERNFDRAMRAFRALGKVSSEAVSGEDVTSQVVDLDARIKTLRGEEEQYLQILRRANKIGEVLAIRERLGQVRQEIESMVASRKNLASQASYSTIRLTLEQKSKEPVKKASDDSWAGETWTNATEGLASAFRAIGSLLITLFVYSPIWLPVLIVGWILYKRANKV